jgi:uncharacterized tellurite resistance protein B-like protein
MDAKSQEQLLVKILIGIAWLDGEIQPEERTYLLKFAQEHQIEHPAIDELLANSIGQEVCEDWIKLYLNDSSALKNSIESQERLLEAVSGIIYSDGDIATAEAQVLMSLQPEQLKSDRDTPAVIAKLRQLYQNWVKKIS